MRRYLTIIALLILTLVTSPAFAHEIDGVIADSIPDYEKRDSLDMVMALSEEGKAGFVQRVIPPSPQAAAITRYAEYPVSHATGIPDISVPLYTIRLGAYELPVTISYHASGSRPDQMPTPVGLGWTLNAGGAITRTILGKPDMYYVDVHHTDYRYYDENNLRETIDEISKTGGGPHRGDLSAIITDSPEWDTESDRYCFNVAGISGIFRYSYEDRGYVVLNNSNQVVLSSGNAGNGVVFTLFDTDGTEYEFAKEEKTGAEDYFNGGAFATAWYVTRIHTPYGDIRFTYEDGLPVDILCSSSRATSGPKKKLMENPTGDYYMDEEYVVVAQESQYTVSYGHKLLKKIEWNGNHIDFSYVDEHPRKTFQRLVSMQVSGADGNLIKSVAFDNTDNWPTGNSLTGRRMLKSVSDSREGIWTFGYDRSKKLPPLSTVHGHPMSCESDFWGYWNSDSVDLYMSVFTQGQVDWLEKGYMDYTNWSSRDVDSRVYSRDRGPSLSHTKAGVLNKVTFPTGGSLAYEYELNSVGARLVGGLRVKSVSVLNNAGTTLRKKTYGYYGEKHTTEDPEDLMKYISHEHIIISSGTPVPPELGVGWPYSYRTCSDSPINPATGSSSPVVYSNVVETRDDGVRVSSAYDGSELISLYGIPSDEYVHPSLFQQSIWDMGNRDHLLRHRQIHDAEGRLLYEEEYEYEKKERRKFIAGVRTACPFFEYEYPPRMFDSWSGIDTYDAAHFGMIQHRKSYAFARANVLKSKTVTDHTTGFSTTTRYDYDPDFRTMRPKSETVTGSDGSTHRTEYTYPFELTDSVSRSMAELFICNMPVETATYMDGRLLSKDRTDFRHYKGFYIPSAQRTWSMPTSDALRTPPSVLPERERITAYNGMGRPLSVIVNATDTTTFKWSGTGDLLESVTYPGGLTTAYTHRPLLGLSSVTLPNGHRTAYAYNAAGMLSEVSDNLGTTDRYSYSLMSHSSASMRGLGNAVSTERMLDGPGTRSVLTRQFYGSLGEPSTLVRGGVNTDGRYVYTATSYDRIGRENCDILSAVGGTSPDFKGFNDVTALSEETYSDTYTRSETSYDALDRPVSVTTPGQAWRDKWKSRKTEYVSNAAGSVRLYSAPMTGISLVQDGYYAAGTLQGTRTIDEDGKEMTVYTDRLGRKVLERRGPESRKGHNDTYFVHNALGQLRYVLSPGYEASASKDKFAYEYRYDEHGNVVRKSIPGAGYTQYWYDRAGRMAFMQDEVLRQKGLYRFFIHDRAGRQVIQGTAASCPRGTEVNFADYTGGTSGFMSTGYTIADPSRLQQVTLERVDYNDTYGFVSAYDSRLSKASTASATGLATGTVAYASDGERSVSAFYYDLRGNVTECREITAFGTLRTTANTYTYSGQPLSTSVSENGVTVLTENGYDAATGLLLHTDVTVNGTRQRVSAVSYDGLGRIASITRGGTDGKGGTVAYAYDLHGRTVSIEGPGFTQRLHYTDGPGKSLYNGSVSAMVWTMGDATERGYRYTYNDYGWLTAAEYGEGTTLSSNRDRYTEKTTEFMRNGGISRLQRHGLKADGSYGKVDDLQVFYDGNRITGVLEDADAVTENGSMDFAGDTGVISEMEYDSAGALVRDEARGITSITYDSFGNPLRISFPKGGYSSYVYSATGEKLKARHYVNMAVQVNPGVMVTSASFPGSDKEHAGIAGLTEYEYRGPVVYRDGVPEKVLFPGGYATVRKGVTFHYYTQDYLGNNRAVVNGSSGAVEQTVAYYPYGGVIPELGTYMGNQPFKFGGKELVRTNGLNEYDFGARQYYQAVPHFTRIDPLCEKYYWLSPYLYCGNNPVNAIDPDGRETILWATRLPDGPEWANAATHTFITVSQKGKIHYFAYGSEYDGLRGAIGGKLTRCFYKQDEQIYKGQNDDSSLLKTKITIDPPEGMTQEQFDNNVIETAESYGEVNGISYFLSPVTETQGNCNTSTSTILFKAGISNEQLKTIKDKIPDLDNGFGDIKPWTETEQKDALYNQSILYETLEQSLH